MSDPNGGIFSKVVSIVVLPYYWLKRVLGGKK